MASQMEITLIESFGPNFVDRSGTENQHGVKFIRPLGRFRNGYVAWECQCPHCDSYFNIAANAVKRQKSCGCYRDRPGRPRKSAVEHYWMRMMKVSHDIVAEWKDVQTFKLFCQSIDFCINNFETRKLVCGNPDLPLGPDNYVLTENAGAWTRSKMVKYAGEWISVSRAAAALGISRQCAHQMRIERLQERLNSLNE